MCATLGSNIPPGLPIANVARRIDTDAKPVYSKMDYVHVFVIFDANIRHLNEKRNGKRKVILPGSMVPDEHLSGRSCAMRVYCEWKAGRELQWEATTGVCAREQT